MAEPRTAQSSFYFQSRYGMSAYCMGNQERQTAVMGIAHLDLRYKFSNNLPNILAQPARLQQSYVVDTRLQTA